MRYVDSTRTVVAPSILLHGRRESRRCRGARRRVLHADQRYPDALELGCEAAVEREGIVGAGETLALYRNKRKKKKKKGKNRRQGQRLKTKTSGLRYRYGGSGRTEIYLWRTSLVSPRKAYQVHTAVDMHDINQGERSVTMVTRKFESFLSKGCALKKTADTLVPPPWERKGEIGLFVCLIVFFETAAGGAI